jgi:hypothetical protein
VTWTKMSLKNAKQRYGRHQIHSLLWSPDVCPKLMMFFLFIHLVRCYFCMLSLPDSATRKRGWEKAKTSIIASKLSSDNLWHTVLAYS